MWEPCCAAVTTNLQSKDKEEAKELMPPPLSRLCRFPNATNKSQLSAVLLQGYASAAESVKKALISDLTSRDSFDVESMVDIANDAFASLASLQADFADLYYAVRDLIFYHWQFSEAKKELDRNGCLQAMEARHSHLCDQSDLALKALLGAKVSLAKTEKLVTPFVRQIAETRELLNKLEEKLVQGNMELGELRGKCDRLEKCYEAAKTEEQNVAKQVEEHKKVIQPINNRCDDAMAGIGRIKVLLSTMS